MKESLVSQCLSLLKREDVKTELRNLYQPLIDGILYEINPYIYITVSLVFLIFIMILAILLILMFKGISMPPINILGVPNKWFKSYPSDSI